MKKERTLTTIMEKETTKLEKYYMEDDEINLREIIDVIWRRKKVIITIIVLALLVASIYIFSKKPVYEMSSTVYLGNFRPNNMTNTDNSIYTNPKNAKEILLSDDLIAEVASQLHMDENPLVYTKIKGKVTIDEISGTSFLQLKVRDTDRKEGKKIIEKMLQIYTNLSSKDYNANANLISQQLNTVKHQLSEKDEQMDLVKKEISKVENRPNAYVAENEIKINSLYDQMRDADSQRVQLLDRYLELQKEQDAMDSLKVINQVSMPQSPVEPKKTFILFISLVTGCILGVFVAFIRDYIVTNPSKLK